MSELLSRPLLRRDDPRWGSRLPWLAAVLAAAWTMVAGLSLCVLPGVSVWIAEGAQGPLSGPLRFGGRLWLAGHGANVQAGDKDLGIAPLGLTVLVVLLLYRSARWAAHSAGVSTTRGALAVAIPAVLTYAVGAGVVAGVVGTPDVGIVPAEAVAWAGMWAAAAVACGVGPEGGVGERWIRRIPATVRIAVIGATAAVAGVMAVGSVLVVIGALVGSGRIGALAEALDAGALGGTLLAVGGVALVPNAIVWAATFALGPGFAVGVGTSVAPGGVELGLVPALPILGALPESVPAFVSWLVLLGPVAAGIVAGLIVLRRVQGLLDGRAGGEVSLSATTTIALTAVGAALLASVAMAVAADLSGGSAGADRLAVVGPVPWQAAAATLALVGVPLVAAALVWHHYGADGEDRVGEDPDDDEDADVTDDGSDDTAADAAPVDDEPGVSRDAATDDSQASGSPAKDGDPKDGDPKDGDPKDG